MFVGWSSPERQSRRCIFPKRTTPPVSCDYCVRNLWATYRATYNNNRINIDMARSRTPYGLINQLQDIGCQTTRRRLIDTGVISFRGRLSRTRYYLQRACLRFHCRDSTPLSKLLSEDDGSVKSPAYGKRQRIKNGWQPIEIPNNVSVARK